MAISLVVTTVLTDVFGNIAGKLWSSSRFALAFVIRSVFVLGRLSWGFRICICSLYLVVKSAEMVRCRLWEKVEVV